MTAYMVFNRYLSNVNQKSGRLVERNFFGMKWSKLAKKKKAYYQTKALEINNKIDDLIKGGSIKPSNEDSESQSNDEEEESSE